VTPGDAPFLTSRDCSPFLPMDRAQEVWLTRLLKAATPAVILGLGGRRATEDVDDEPIAAYDGKSGMWWAGRYIGELHFEGKMLRIEPRFGRPSLMRWLTSIWSVQLLETKGSYQQQQRVWLWVVIARLWAVRLIAAAKHGLPWTRIAEVHRGRALRGKLLPRPTALSRATGSDQVFSFTRNRVVDPTVGGVLLAAFGQLRVVLAAFGDVSEWLPDRGVTIIDELRHALGERVGWSARTRHSTIRYTPITETYRPVVELSQSILNQRPMTSSASGSQDVFGVMLDMAEVWELYVAKLLQLGLPGFRVVHTGRLKEHFKSLLRSPLGGELGSLRPDIVISDPAQRCVAIADAKYKTTAANAWNRTGILREDLYQISAYLAGFGDPGTVLNAFLIYPSDDTGEVARRLLPNNPWCLSSVNQRNLWFLSADYRDAGDNAILSDRELGMAAAVRTAIAGNS
jgi:5-methylcytosine-specific restriction enzyme subunit McrC